MPSMQNVMVTRPRLLWGERLNLITLLVFQVLAVVVFVSVPFLANRWLLDYSDFSVFEYLSLAAIIFDMNRISLFPS